MGFWRWDWRKRGSPREEDDIIEVRGGYGDERRIWRREEDIEMRGRCREEMKMGMVSKFAGGSEWSSLFIS